MALKPTYPKLRTLPKMIAFLEEKLSDAEMEQIEQIIEEDELYAYALEKLHQAMLKGENVEAVAANFQEVFINTIREEAKPEAKKIAFPIWRVVAVAAAVVILAIVFFPREQSIIDEPISPYEPRFSVRGDQSELIGEFLSLYRQKDYEKAIALGENILNDSIADSPNIVDELHMSLGNCELGLGNNAQAIPWLEKALNSGEGRIRTEARWYLALAYLKQENIDSAKKYLQEMTPPDAGKSRVEDAQELLQRLQ